MNRKFSAYYNRNQRVIVASLVLVAMCVGWHWLSLAITITGTYGEPLFPSWSHLITKSLREMALYGGEGQEIAGGSEVGQANYLDAIRVIGGESLATGKRLFGGLLLGSFTGTGLGLLISASGLLRRMFALMTHLLRMVPFLAMIPLFSLWFGASTRGIITFVAYGVGAVMFVSTFNAVGNIPDVYFRRAASVGSSRFHTYWSVVVPSIFPKLRSGILLSLGLAWSLVTAAELLGAPSGLGVVLSFGFQFANTGRMIVISLVIVIYATVSYVIFEYISNRIVAWQPQPFVPALARGGTDDLQGQGQ